MSLLSKILILLLCCILITPMANARESSTWSYKSITFAGKPIKYISVPRDSGYEVVASVSNTGASLQSLIVQVDGVAGINGAYFIPRDYTKRPDATNAPRISWGNMQKYSRYAPDTGVNVLFGWDRSRTPLVVQNNLWSDRLLRQNYNSGALSRVDSGIGNFPTLLINGHDTLPLYKNTTLITPKMAGLSTKSFICFTEGGDINMGIVSKITLAEMPGYLLKLGCRDALNLDNGGSSALYAWGKYQVWPGRNIMDGFVVRKRTAR